MQLSLVFTILLTFATIAVAYPTPEFGTKLTCEDSYATPVGGNDADMLCSFGSARRASL